MKLLEEGTFIPTSNELMKQWGFRTINPCLYCELSSLCRRFDLGVRSRNGKFFQEIAVERFAAMTGQPKGAGDCAQ